MRASFVVAAVSVTLAASSALADGKVVPRAAGPGPGRAGERVPARQRVVGEDRGARRSGDPDQKALIVQRDGRETLVIETSFTGRGNDFAWVVPTPTVPKIETASTELFADLSSRTRPELVSRVPDLGLAGLVGVAALLLVRHGGPGARRKATALIAGAVAVAFVLQAGPRDAGAEPLLTLGASSGIDVRVPMTPAEDFVAVKQREVVGAYDTVTLSARDPKALVAWLRGHEYAVPEGTDEVAADYVRDGWVFTAVRLRRDADSADTVRIQPLAFTFAAAEPVYPMRLTGVATGAVRVDLFIAGVRRAEADGFVVDHCARIDTSGRRAGGAGFRRDPRRSAHSPRRRLVRDDAPRRHAAARGDEEGRCGPLDGLRGTPSRRVVEEGGDGARVERGGSARDRGARRTRLDGIRRVAAAASDAMDALGHDGDDPLRGARHGPRDRGLHADGRDAAHRVGPLSGRLRQAGRRFRPAAGSSLLRRRIRRTRAPATRYSSSNHFPRSLRRQRSLQNGKDGDRGFVSSASVSIPQRGQAVRSIDVSPASRRSPSTKSSRASCRRSLALRGGLRGIRLARVPAARIRLRRFRLGRFRFA